jgi:NAD+ synthase
MNENAIAQRAIIDDMMVKPQINVAEEIRKRIDFIKGRLLESKTRHLVLGISGGVDSSTAGRLCQLAIDELNAKDFGYEFIAMRLPYGVQQDEADAQRALEFIQPSRVVTVNIKTSVDAMFNESYTSLELSGIKCVDEKHKDFVKGNIKARARMIAQYTIANQVNGLVVGTDHSAEATMGFYTKFGDGACDLAPLFGLNKRQVRRLCAELGAPEAIYQKPATADLEDLDPQALDEDRLGVSYDDLDDFLEGKPVAQEVSEAIIQRYRITQHKRQSIPTPVTV